MFILQSETQLAPAVAKARRVKPRVSAVAFRQTATGFYGLYYVKGQQGDVYAVSCERNEHGRRLVHCDCAGGMRGKECYHAAAAIGLHVVLAMDADHPLRLKLKKSNVIQFPERMPQAA